MRDKISRNVTHYLRIAWFLHESQKTKRLAKVENFCFISNFVTKIELLEFIPILTDLAFPSFQPNFRNASLMTHSCIRPNGVGRLVQCDQ